MTGLAPPRLVGGTVLAVGLGAACSDGDPAGPRAAEVVISADGLVFESLGETRTLSATATTVDGTVISTPVHWTATDPSVVTVSGAGAVRSVGNGEALVVASVDAAGDTVQVSVAQIPTSLTLSGPDTVFNPGVPTRLVATALDALGSDYVRTPLEWQLDDPALATLEPGLLTPITGGDATVTVRAGDLTAEKVVTAVPDIELDVPAELATALQWAMEDSAAANGVIGASAAIGIPGVGWWRGVTGRSDDTSVLRPDMMFYPGSIKKMITSAAVLSLVDDGVLTLDDSVGTWVDPFESPNIPLGVTIRQLLQNTSGIYSYSSHPNLGDSLFADDHRIWDPREALEKFVLAPEFPPGTAWKSSNTGYMLSGLAAEAATGRPLPELLRARVFDVAGMEEAWVAGFEERPAPVASTWRGPPGGPLVSSEDLTTLAAYTLLWPQSVLSAPALLAFGTALFGDFLSSAVRQEMMTTVPDDGGIPGQVAGGLGIRKYDFLGRTQWGHSGSQGTGSGFFIWDEASGIGIAILYNQNGGSHRNSHFRLVPALLGLALAAQGTGLR